MSLTHMDPAEASSREPNFARTPPQDLVAEQSVLGGMMLSKDAIADCVEVLRGNDFYRPAHESIYEAICDLYGRGEPADAVTVSDELTKRKEISRVGGPAYLHTLISSVPTAANASFYAEIVRERSVLRRLVDAGTKIVQLGYGNDGEVDDIVNAAQAEIYAVSERRTTEDYVALKDVIEGTVDEIEASGHRGTEMAGVPTGFYELDDLTHGLHPGQMIVIAARPAIGKSTLALDIARSAAIKHSLTTVVFSLEMSRNEIATKLLAAEATINLQDLRKGTIRDEQWSKIATTMGRMNDAPLFIDDSPNMSLMEIRAKCRRLKQRHDLKLVIIDYLQLMSSGKKVESRQQEVSEFSRALKLLAKELGVPVIALSQLNRGSEQRPDKKPMVSDLRESGCLTGDTRILRSDTGAETTMRELFDSGAKDIPVWSLDDSLRYVERHLTHVFSTGKKPVYRLTMSSGKTVRATSNHPFFTYDGWRALGDLRPSDRLAVPRHVNGPTERSHWDDDMVLEAARLMDGASRIPAEIFALPKEKIALFLRNIWARGGMTTIDRSAGTGTIRYFGTFQGSLDSLSLLMLRFGISCEIRLRLEKFSSSRFVLEIGEPDDQRRFLQEIEAHGLRSAESAELLRMVRAKPEMDSDPGMPTQVAEGLQVLLSPDSPGEFKAGNQRHSMGGSLPLDDYSGERLAGVVDVLDAADMDFVAVNDVMWDEVVAIEPDGEEEVFDATVLGNHNFIANGIAVHNSIEQDADMVVLLHREDMYDKESARAGEADVIVAKHRNGPTKTIVVGFQGHYSRFSNMAVEQ
ncbi:replicative DNA helicase [Arthrobacter sp. H14]|uniref:replicative DNA helicase n=1 Tax=Arthrobacter sp. H14 TaxID=1312959 RepID=UPI0004B345FD|nr:replicative DNA helicase [Arthrobacter sp. H14]